MNDTVYWKSKLLANNFCLIKAKPNGIFCFFDFNNYLENFSKYFIQKEN